MTSHSQSIRESLLASALAAAVPLWILRMRDWTFDERQRRATECSQIVAEKGDIILFRGKTPGESAKAFNALAEGIACLAFCPGGVRTFGMHFDATVVLGHLGIERDDEESRQIVLPNNWLDGLCV